MPPVYREVELTWGDQTYKVTPTFRLIQQIEQKYSIAALINRAGSGDAPFSHIAEVIAALLRHAGCKVDAEDVYMSLVSGERPGAFGEMLAALIQAFIPQSEEAKRKPSPLAQILGPPKAEASTGANTTSAPSGDSESSPPNSGA